MIILGLNHGEINSSAALYKDGRIIAGAPEERFNRQKRTKNFPAAATKFCLKHANIDLKNVDFIAQAWNPGATWIKYNPLISSSRIRREDYFYSVPDHLFNLTNRNPQDWVFMDFPENCNIPPIYYIQHHRTHAANTFFLSPFEDAAFITADWRGEFECSTMGKGTKNELEIISTQKIPDSLGMFYATYTELLGYRPDSDEWKVMALSAFDLDCEAFVNKIKNTFELCDNGRFKLDQSYYKGTLLDQPKLYTEKLVQLLGGKEGIPNAEPDGWYIAIAKAMQMVSEEIATHQLNYLYEVTKCKNVVLGGGFFMNSVYNGKVLKKTPFDRCYISYSPSDVGNSIGAALYVAHCIKEQKRNYSFNNSFIGPCFTDNDIRQSLERRKLQYIELENPCKAIAKLITDGEIVAHFNGRMEFGERALGNRSILGDPRNPKIKDRINSIIKYRESYRPFAPAVVFEDASKFFEVENNYECHFMEKVVPVQKGYRDKLPAITHVDGSGRLQTVKKDHNERFYNIISEVGKISGFPIVLNTSFNINGEPIVQSPDDALNTFFNSGLTHLVLGKYLIQKSHYGYEKHSRAETNSNLWDRDKVIS
jgi:carbamoyltransferase